MLNHAEKHRKRLIQAKTRVEEVDGLMSNALILMMERSFNKFETSNEHLSDVVYFCRCEGQIAAACYNIPILNTSIRSVGAIVELSRDEELGAKSVECVGFVVNLSLLGGRPVDQGNIETFCSCQSIVVSEGCKHADVCSESPQLMSIVEKILNWP